MLDIHNRAHAVSDVIQNVEFFRIELSPLKDGHIFVSLTATTVDEDEPQLLDQEIASERIATIDDLLTLIRTHVHIGALHQPPLPSCLS